MAIPGKYRAAVDTKSGRRMQADMLLLLAALIWGVAFVAQKAALAHVGPYTFIAARFFLSALLILPLAWREQLNMVTDVQLFTGSNAGKLALLCTAFSGAIIWLQLGIADTTVTSAGFLTSLYVLFVPLIGRILYGQRLSLWMVPAAILSISGVWLLSGGTLETPAPLEKGDALVLLAAVGFALHFVLAGKLMKNVDAPYSLSCLQYCVVALFSLFAALAREHPDFAHIREAWLPIIYAGAISGAIAYTIEIVVLQYTSATYSAVILSAEAVFAAIAGSLLMHDHLTVLKVLGCFMIICAILFGPLPPRRHHKEKTTAKSDESA